MLVSTKKNVKTLLYRLKWIGIRHNTIASRKFLKSNSVICQTHVENLLSPLTSRRSFIAAPYVIFCSLGRSKSRSLPQHRVLRKRLLREQEHTTEKFQARARGPYFQIASRSPRHSKFSRTFSKTIYIEGQRDVTRSCERDREFDVTRCNGHVTGEKIRRQRHVL